MFNQAVTGLCPSMDENCWWTVTKGCVRWAMWVTGADSGGGWAYGLQSPGSA